MTKLMNSVNFKLALNRTNKSTVEIKSSFQSVFINIITLLVVNRIVQNISIGMLFLNSTLVFWKLRYH